MMFTLKMKVEQFSWYRSGGSKEMIKV